MPGRGTATLLFPSFYSSLPAYALENPIKSVRVAHSFLRKNRRVGEAKSPDSNKLENLKTFPFYRTSQFHRL